MNSQRVLHLKLIGGVAAANVIIGLAVMLSGFFVSDATARYFLFAGLGVIVAAVLLFLIGTGLVAMEGVTRNGSPSGVRDSRVGS